jgi:MFS family permease
MSDPPRHPRRIVAVSLVVGFMSLLDASVVNIALPSMQDDLGAGVASTQWVVSGYALAFALTLVAGGRLGDVHGRRLLLLVGVGAFVVASAAVGLAPTVELAIAARVVQGAAAGLTTPQSAGLIQELFDGAARGKAFGALGFTVSTGAAAGPVVGGLVIAAAGSADGWRYVFWINVPIGLLALAVIAAVVPRHTGPPAHDDGGYDAVGTALLGLAVLAVLVPVAGIDTVGVVLLPLLLVAVVLGVLFLRWERRLSGLGRTPLLDVGTLGAEPSFVHGLLVATLYFTGFTGFLLALSFHLQHGLKQGALATALLLVAYDVGSAVAAAAAGQVVSRAGRWLVAGALATMVTGVVLVLLLLPDHPPLWPLLVPTLLLAGLGGGAVVSPNQTLTLAKVPTETGGAAGGALQTGQWVGASLGSALLLTLYQTTAGPLGATGALRLALGTGTALLLLALAVVVRAGRREPADLAAAEVSSG